MPLIKIITLMPLDFIRSRSIWSNPADMVPRIEKKPINLAPSNLDMVIVWQHVAQMENVLFN